MKRNIDVEVYLDMLESYSEVRKKKSLKSLKSVYDTIDFFVLNEISS